MHMHMHMCMCMCMCMCMYCEGGPQRRHAASLAEGAQAQRTLFGRDATHVVGALLASDSEGGQGDCGATAHRAVLRGRLRQGVGSSSSN